MKAIVTGGAGFIGSHAAIRLAREGCDVLVIDNLYRARLLGGKQERIRHNWDRLSRFRNIKLHEADIRDSETMNRLFQGASIVVHAAGQTAVTHSMDDPALDFHVNAAGTLNVLEATRRFGSSPVIIYCSTNKVYGGNVDKPELSRTGVPEFLSVDLCEHTPYGCSKLAGDLYVQDYARLYGLKTGVFRMSCIFGTHQSGFEDQGWVAWFIIAALTGKKVTIYGDGKQVRDLLWIDDLIELWMSFINSSVPHGVYNIGGGPNNTLSLLQLNHIIRKYTGIELKPDYAACRPGDQQVYVSNIDKAFRDFGWKPEVCPETGIKRLLEWAQDNIHLLA